MNNGIRYALVSLSVLAWPILTSAAPVQWSGNGHFYDVIDIGLTWDDAKRAAEAATFMGIPGRLATVTSAEENMFLTDTFGANRLHLHWIGGFQAAGSPEPAGGWSWVTGEGFFFSNWWPPAEPNNVSGVPGENEDGVVFDHGVTANGKSWNDLPRTRIGNGYVVEFAVSTGPCDELDPCPPNTGSVGEGACIGDLACAGNSGSVGKHGCHGDRACLFNAGAVGDTGCVGEGACMENVGDIDKAGCIGDHACADNESSVGAAACVGDDACGDNGGDIEKLGCRGPSACSANAGAIGEAACQGPAVCGINFGNVRKAGCIGSQACFGNRGEVGEAACVGDVACGLNTSDIGKLSCRGSLACRRHWSGAVGANACLGVSACESSQQCDDELCEFPGPTPIGDIGNGACHGDRACFNNYGPIPAGACVGPPDPVTGRGVCEVVR